MADQDTIVAIATAPGRAAVGMVRISGDRTPEIARQVLGELPPPRLAAFCAFMAAEGGSIDRGLALYFPAPHSYTGEHVLELHTHGSPVVLDLLTTRICSLGARLARPGEFSLRAFLNDKLDLAQAEAVADLIESQSTEAARAAMRSLEGQFSAEITALQERLTGLRAHIEADFDFPDEEIDLDSAKLLIARLESIEADVTALFHRAGQGALLREGATVAIAGRPNVGKSSLLNVLSGRDAAIVTSVPGTTRDPLRETIDLSGIPLRLVDTAGLRESLDIIEQEGMRRTWLEIERADLTLLLIDDFEGKTAEDVAIQDSLSRGGRVALVHNKIDLSGAGPGEREGALYISAKTGDGIDQLRAWLLRHLRGGPATESTYLARRRHLAALTAAREALGKAKASLLKGQAELTASDLRAAHEALGEIVGGSSVEAVLDRIFSTFCIGK